MISKKQFDLLVELKRRDRDFSQRELAQAAGMSIGMVNKLLGEFTDGGLLAGKRLSDAGYAALEPFRVKKAVILAAGFGSRLVPITLNTPKPLVRVKGRCIIQTLLSALTAAGITDITIVRGYLGEQFDQLRYSFPSIRFVENPAYLESNNISSAYCVRYEMQRAYVCEADLYVQNPSVITEYQYASNYLGVPTEKTDDWCFSVSGGYIRRMAIGGEHCYHMFGISYWTDEDGARLADRIKSVYESPGGKERYWDQVALEYYLPEFRVAVRECTFDDIVEIDTFSELKRFDPTYDV